MPLAAALVAAGCQDAPSFEASWRIHSGDTPDISPALCAAHGFGGVRVAVHENDNGELGALLRADEHPCYPRAFAEDGGVAGPKLGDGEYFLRFEPLRRHREDGDSWDGLAVPPVGGLPVLIEGGAADPFLIDVDLPAPPECDDGVDNDADGFVDARDPGCVLGREDAADGSETIVDLDLRIAVSLFGEQPIRPCGAGGVNQFRISVDPNADTPGSTRTFACRGGDADDPFARTRFRERLSTGVHELVITGLAQDEEVTVPKSIPFAFSTARSVTLEADLGPGDFSPTLVAPARFVPLFEGPDGVAYGCAIGGGPPSWRPTVRAARTPDAPYVLATDGTPLDGRERPCDALQTVDLTWGHFDLTFTAGGDDDQPCWSSAEAAVPLAPWSANVPVTLPLDPDAPESCTPAD